MVVNSLNPTSLSRPEDIKREPLTDGQTVLAQRRRKLGLFATCFASVFKLLINFEINLSF